MGLRCLLGHDFGEPETEREREEQGNEVVITVRDVKTCSRCGERQVVTENKEVTSLDQLVSRSDAGGAGGPSDAGESSATAPAGSSPGGSPGGVAERAADAESPGDAGGTSDGEPTVTDAVAADASDADESAVDAESAGDVAAESSHPAERGVDEGDDVSAEEDDAVILDSEPGVDEERDPTQWPDEPPRAEEMSPGPDDAVTDAPARYEEESDTADVDADAASGDAPDDGEVVEEDGIIMAEDDSDDDGDESQYLDSWPDPKADEDEGWDASPPSVDEEDDDGVVEAAADAATGLSGSGDAAQADAETRSVAPTDDAVFEPADVERATPEFERTTPESELEFYCPACGHARAVGESSMRAGDICPECREGYIAERPAEQ